MIFLSLVLALVGWSTVGADDGFYVIGGGKSASVPETAQTASYDQNIPQKDDGALKKGVAWPTPRFTDNGNDTVTDNLTKLIWLKNANYHGMVTWNQALIYAANTYDSLDPRQPGPNDGSKKGDWRLPNLRELQSLIDYSKGTPALPAGHPFTGVQSSVYWSSTTYAFDGTYAWYVDVNNGVAAFDAKGPSYVWFVRGGP